MTKASELKTANKALSKSDSSRSGGWSKDWSFDYKVPNGEEDTRQLGAIRANTVIGPVTVANRLRKRMDPGVRKVTTDAGVFLAGALTGIMAYTVQHVGYRRKERKPPKKGKGIRIQPKDVKTELLSNTAFMGPKGFSKLVANDSIRSDVRREAEIEEWRTSSIDKGERFKIYEQLSVADQKRLWEMQDDDREELFINGMDFVNDYFSNADSKRTKKKNAKAKSKKTKPKSKQAKSKQAKSKQAKSKAKTTKRRQTASRRSPRRSTKKGRSR